MTGNVRKRYVTRLLRMSKKGKDVFPICCLEPPGMNVCAITPGKGPAQLRCLVKAKGTPNGEQKKVVTNSSSEGCDCHECVFPILF